jgi:predicted amidohydrolase YtcJ
MGAGSVAAGRIFAVGGITWLAIAGGLVGCGCGAPVEPADLVIRNARIYTASARAPWAEAVAVRDGRIAYVGVDAGVDELSAESTRVVDARGRLVLPGFIDSHNHIVFGGGTDTVSFSGATSLAEIQERIRRFAEAHPDREWIEGHGWNYSALPESRLPTAADLDGLTGGRPALLDAYDGHTIWLNRRAMQLLGIARDTGPTKYGMRIQYENGEPTGILYGGAAAGGEGWEEMSAVLPQAAPEEIYRGFAHNLDSAIRFGITTIVDPQSDPDRISLYERAEREGALKSRLRVALFHAPGTSEEEIRAFEEIRDAHRAGRIRVPAVKLYIDDVIEPHNAALLEPYADAPETSGETFYTPDDFARVVTGLDARGFQLFIHAIGDRGIRVALDAIEAAQTANARSDTRHQLVHVELLSPRDVPRFGELGVVACMQPRHAAPDISGGQWAAALGERRSEFAWAFRSLLDSGAPLAFSSDWPVSEMDPLVGIYTAVSRRGLDGTPAEGWISGQRIGVAEAVDAYTIGGAYANFIDTELGSIEAGKRADLIVLSRDIFEVPFDQILETRVLLTLVDGEEVHRDPELD